MSNYTPYYEGGWKNEEEMTTTPICAEALNHMEEGISAAYDTDIGLYPVESASGDVAVIHDGADNLPVRALSVAIEPVQFLNGYERPWAGGAGKNILPLTAGTKTANGVTATVNANGVISLSGTATADGFLTIASGLTFQAGTYTLKEFTADGKITSAGVRSQVISSTANTGISVQWSDAQGTAKSGTLATASDYIFRIRIENGKSYAGITITPMLVKGSDAPTSYEPYSNICPISGWDAVKVARTGKNLFYFDSTKTTTGETTAGAIRAYYPLEVSNCTLSFSAELINSGSTTTSNINIGKLKDGILSILNNFISLDRITERTFTFSENEQAVLMSASTSVTSITSSLPKYRICVTTDSTPQAYEPYQGTTYPITFPTEAGTVYGGTLDVTKGILTVDRGFVTWNGTEDWVLSGGKKVRCNIYALQNLIKRPAAASEILEGLQASYLTAQTDNATYQGTVGISCQTNGVVGITLTGEATTVDAVKAYLAEHPLQVVYPLATPQTYTLTPTEIKTLLGENRIYADAGQVTVQYRADFNEAGLMYIPKAPTADGTYRLTADVTGGTPTYRWEAAE